MHCRSFAARDYIRGGFLFRAFNGMFCTIFKRTLDFQKNIRWMKVFLVECDPLPSVLA